MSGEYFSYFLSGLTVICIAVGAVFAGFKGRSDAKNRRVQDVPLEHHILSKLSDIHSSLNTLNRLDQLINDFEKLERMMIQFDKDLGIMLDRRHGDR